MSRGQLCILICILMISSIIVPTSASTPSETISHSLSRGNVLYVGGVGSNNYTKIQDAVNDAVDGDMIFVYDDSSPYYENIIIEKSIVLIGENRETTHILGDETSDGVIMNISADDVGISGFTIQPNSGSPAGIIVCKNYTSPDHWNIASIQNVMIFNNIIRDTGWPGIFGIRLNYGNIYGNCIDHCGGGVVLFISSNNTITNNVISDCTGRGIFIGGAWGPYRIMNYRNPRSCNNVIAQNIIVSNRWGIELNSGPVNTKISANNITGNHESGLRIFQASKTEVIRNNFIDNTEQAYFDVVCVLRYPQFTQNTWENNYWGEPRKMPVRVKGAFIFMLFPRIPIDIVFQKFSLTQYEVPWMMVDWHPAQEPYDIPGMR